MEKIGLGTDWVYNWFWACYYWIEVYIDCLKNFDSF